MKKWKARCVGLTAAAVLMPSLAVNAQIPAVPAAPALGGGPVVPVAPAAAPATIWQKLGISKEQRLQCKYQMCQSKIGQLLNNATKPLAALTGGLLGDCCPTTPSPFELAKPGAEGAAAAIQKDTAEAKARRAAVRYLGTVDCHWWPEAEKALIGALRTDRNECVRWEAAMALGSGCCCTKDVITSLAITISGSEKDGAPAETSERVKSAAEGTLQHCLACYEKVETVPEVPAPPAVPQKPERSPERGTPAEREHAPPGGMSLLTPEAAHLALYYNHVMTMPIAQVVSDARRAMEKRLKEPVVGAPLPTGAHDLFHVVATAVGVPSSGRLSGPVTIDSGVTMAAPVGTASEPNGMMMASMEKPVVTTPSAAMPVVETPAVVVMPTGVPVEMSMPDKKSHKMASRKPAAAPMPVMASVAAAQVAGRDAKANAFGPMSPMDRPMRSPMDRPTSYASAWSPPAQELPALSSTFVAGPVSSVSAPSSSFAPSPCVMSSPSASSVVPAGGFGPSIQPLLTVIRTSNFPSQREWAVETMASINGRDRPEVVAALLTAASQDPAGSVRAACVRSLAQLHLRTQQVVTAFQMLQGDIDPQVRHEATVAMAQVNGQTSPTSHRP